MWKVWISIVLILVSLTALSEYIELGKLIQTIGWTFIVTLVMIWDFLWPGLPITFGLIALVLLITEFTS